MYVDTIYVYTIPTHTYMCTTESRYVFTVYTHTGMCTTELSCHERWTNWLAVLVSVYMCIEMAHTAHRLYMYGVLMCWISLVIFGLCMYYMFAWICVHLNICIFVCMHAYLYICTNINDTYACICILICIRVYLNEWIFDSAWTLICIYMCIHTCMIYIHLWYL